MENLLVNTLQDNSELYEHHRFQVDKRQSACRVDKYLSGKIAGVSRTKIQYAAEAGNIIVNNKPVRSNYKIKPDDIISVVLPFPVYEFELIPEDIPIHIEYEDEDLLVVNKDAGMVIHPGHGNYTGTLVNALMFHLKDIPLFKSGEQRPGLVHRIDKDTSGIVVVAKTEVALNHLARQFFEHSIKRKYHALVWGIFDNEEGTVEGNVGRHQSDRTRMRVFPEGNEGKNAITHYKVLETLGYVSMLECQLETGRTHQIRVHMEYIGHSVFNDERYGGSRILKGTVFSKYKQFVQNCFTIMPRQALHAKSLEFIHPRTLKTVRFESPLPLDMQTVTDKWRNYVAGRKDEE